MNTLSPSEIRFPLTGELHSIGPGNGTVLWFPIPFTALESSIQTRPWGGDEAADTRVWTFADHSTDLFLQGAESLDDIEPCGMLKGFEGWRRGRVCNAFRRRALLMRPAASSSSTERFAGERAARLACLADPRCVGIQYHHADGTYHIIHPSQCCTTRAAPVEDDGSTSGILVKTGYGGCVDDNCRECGEAENTDPSGIYLFGPMIQLLIDHAPNRYAGWIIVLRTLKGVRLPVRARGRKPHGAAEDG